MDPDEKKPRELLDTAEKKFDRLLDWQSRPPRIARLAIRMYQYVFDVSEIQDVLQTDELDAHMILLAFADIVRECNVKDEDLAALFSDRRYTRGEWID